MQKRLDQDLDPKRSVWIRALPGHKGQDSTVRYLDPQYRVPTSNRTLRAYHFLQVKEVPVIVTSNWGRAVPEL